MDTHLSFALSGIYGYGGHAIGDDRSVVPRCTVMTNITRLSIRGRATQLQQSDSYIKYCQDRLSGYFNRTSCFIQYPADGHKLNVKAHILDPF